MSRTRCVWAGESTLYQAYHDEEWGVPLHDDRALFELLILEGAQAGLSWITVLKKRAAYRTAFDHFDATRIAEYDKSKIESLLQDAGIVRNRLKVAAAVNNAKKFLQVRQECGNFDTFIWSFVAHTPQQNCWRSQSEVPTRSMQSDAMSKELTRRGFKFVGSTICYAYMQATGMVNDHTVDCHRYAQLAAHIEPTARE
jgi:DNA-3-methyladenine glycosylase I